MPGDLERETAIPVRRYEGTMLAFDPGFVPLGFLTRAENWVPRQALVIGKRGGLVPFAQLPAGRVQPLLFATSTDGYRYLYAVVNDTVYLSVDDAPFAPVANGVFTPTAESYAASVFGDHVYIGSDVAPIKRIPLGAAAVDLVPLATAADTGQTATSVDDPTSTCLAGYYAYRWAVYNHTLKQWVGIAAVHTLTTGSGSRQRLAFTAPSAAPAALDLPAEGLPQVRAGDVLKWHLFLAGVDQEIEGAHDQTPDGLAPSTVFAVWDDPIVTTTSVPTPSSVVRRGGVLLTHRGRLWGAGGTGATRRRIWATSVLVPGLEQDLADQGLFFPAGAVSPDLGAPVTGLAVAALSATTRSPTSPLGMFTETGTWLFFGDPVDDPSASLVQVSDEVGCVSAASIVSTPVGVLFLGKRSVYLLLPSQAEPRDVGWPIEPAIRRQPMSIGARAWAIYHRGFYKLALVPAGGDQATEHWWLDLRRGLGDPPSWWGPHRHPPLTAAARAPMHPSENDRAWAAVEGTGEVVRIDVPDVPTDTVGGVTTPIVARLTTGWLDAGAPLQNKLAKRVRGIVRVDDPTSMQITVNADDLQSASGSAPVAATVGGEWDLAEWDTAAWSVSGIQLFEWETPVPEPRGRAFTLDITYSEAVPCELRDVELRVQPSGRDAAGSY